MSDNAALAALIAEDIAENPWPPGFSASDAGTFFTPSTGVGGDAPKPTRICDRFDVVAKTSDYAKENCGLLLSWRDREGHPHTKIISEKMIHMDGGNLAQELAHAGLKVGESKVCHELLKQLLNRVMPKRVLRCVSRSGWHSTDKGFAFVLPSGETCGPGAEDVVLLQKGNDSVEAMLPRGTAKEWYDNVAQYAIGNHRLGLFICAAFTPPLLNITKEGTSGLHLYGPSQKGKTTALQSAASVWGRATVRGGFMRTWRTTDNGLETIAAERSGTLLPLDELGEAEAKAAGQCIYMLGNQSGKARMDSRGAARPVLTWDELVFLSTGEKTLAVKMGEIGSSPMAGQEVRMVNLPSDMGVGLGVFQDLHGMDSGAALSTHLQHATKTYYGVAGREFLDLLIQTRTESPDALLMFIEAERAKFLQANLPLGADGQVVSVARRFGLFAAAGELAWNFGILPWPIGEAHRAAASGLQSWITSRGGIRAAEDTQAVTMVRTFIALHSESRFMEILPRGMGPITKEPDPTPAGQLDLFGPQPTPTPAPADEITEKWKTMNRAGYKRRTEGEWIFLISEDAWRAEVCKGIDPKNAARVLHEKGFLEKADSERHMAKKHWIPDFKQSIRHYTIRGSILSTD